VVAVLIVCALAHSGLAQSAGERQPEERFTSFLTSFGKHYESTPELFKRFGIFRGNLALIAAHNAKNLSWTMGVGPFADLTHEEFMTQYASGIEVPAEQTAAPADAPAFTGNGPFDWVKAGKVTSIKNQANCGSCWAFATSAGVESFHAIKHNQLMDLAPQLLVDCARTSKCHGCQGGWMLDAMSWIHQNGGHCAWQDYPYVAHEQACHGCPKKVQINGGREVHGEGGIEQAGGSQPVVVGLDVSNWQHYEGGLYTGGCGGSPQHAVVVVGAGRMLNQPAWQIKNSWSTAWGAGGYMFMLAGRNLCGIGNWPAIPF